MCRALYVRLEESGGRLTERNLWMFCSRAGLLRGLVALSAVLLFLALLPPGASAAGRGAAVTAETARSEASRLMGKVRAETRANPRSASAEPGWGNASAGDPLLLHSFDGAPTSYLVPVRREDGKAVSVIGVSARTGKWAWYTSVAAPEFPRVDEKEAEKRARALLESRGIHTALPAPTARTAPDKNVYWFFELGAGLPVREVYVPVFIDAGASADTDTKPWGVEQGLSPAPAAGGTTAASSGGTPAPALYPGGAPAAYDIPDVPFHYQETNYWCGPASLEMLFDYWGPDIPQHEIADVVNATPDKGCYNLDLARAAHFSNQSTAYADPWLWGYSARSLGYACSTASWNSMPATRYSDLKELISRGFPVLILTYYDSPPSSGHFRLVKGYNDSLGTFIVHDPWYTPPYQGPNVNFNQSFLVDTLWPYSGRWGMIASPWSVLVSKPTRVRAGQVFQVTAAVEYRGPSPMNGQYPCAADSALATFDSDGAYELLSPRSQAVPGISSTGSAGSVTWSVRSQASQSTGNIQVVAQGLVEGSSYTYPSYYDWIGGVGTGPPPVKPTSRTWGHDSVGVTAPARTWYLAEGCTGTGFETYIVVQNPSDRTANVNLTYMTTGGPVAGPSAAIPAYSRSSFSVADTLPSQWSVSTMVTSDVDVVAERAMYGQGRAWGHDSIGVTTPAAEWYLAEGCTAPGYETWVLVQNPNEQPAEVKLEYMTASGQVDGPKLSLPAKSRQTFFVSDTAPNQWSVSTKVSADRPVIAERSMYGNGRTWGHDSVGATAPSTSWYLAEGCTGSGFETWVVLQNPGSSPAHVRLTYMTPGGALPGPSATLQPHTRKTFNVAESAPGEWEISTNVSSDVGVIAERSMYGGARTWGHDSIGATAPAATWYLAEGCTQTGFETWVLVQNPNDHNVDVELTYMTTGGPVDGPAETIPAGSRMTFNVADTVPYEWEVSTLVKSLNGGVIAERSMYGDPK